MAKTIYAVVQQGGSTHEFYASTYDTEAEALQAIKAHQRASYNSIGPFPVPLTERGKKCYVTEPDLADLLVDVAAAAVDL